MMKARGLPKPLRIVMLGKMALTYGSHAYSTHLVRIQVYGVLLQDTNILYRAPDELE